MKTSRFRKLLWVAAAALVLGWAVPQAVRVNFWREEIAAALSKAVQRPVRVGDVHLQVLGGAGFRIANLVIEEAPGFGYEPFLRAESVEARLALSTLWHGRLEFSSLTLIRPSFNVVRNAVGGWNLALLALPSENASQDTARQHAAASGAAASPASPPVLPQIRIESGRINFKWADRKKAASVLALDMDLIPPTSPRQPWRFEAEGMPARTDIPFHPTGPFRLQGEVGPFSSSIQQETGVPLHLDWTAKDAMLSELLTIAYGSDAGVHSVVSLRGHVAGTTSLFRFSAEAEFDHLHRWDMHSDAEAISLSAKLAGIADLSTASLQLTSLAVPLGEGSVEIRGRVENLFGDLNPAMEMELRQVPLASVAGLAPQFTTRVSQTISAVGTLDGRLRFEPATRELFGTVQVSEGSIRQFESAPPLRFEAFPFVLEGKKGRLGPVKADPGEGDPLLLSWDWDAENQTSTFRLRGQQISLPAVAELAESLGMNWEGDVREGTMALRADVALRAGTPPRVSGWMQLADAEMDYTGINQPVRINSARVQFQNGRMRVEPLAAALGPVEFRGVLRASLPPRHVESNVEEAHAVLIEFDLESPSMDLEEVAGLFRLPPAPRSLLRFGSAQAAPLFADIFPAAMEVSGTLRADTMRWRGAAFENVEASLHLHDRQFAISEFSAEHAGGTQHGSASLSFENAYEFTLETRYEDLNLEDLTQFSERWRGLLSGELSGVLRLAGSGSNWEEIAERLTGSGQARGRSVVLRAPQFAGALGEINSDESRIESLDAEFRIRDRQIHIAGMKAQRGNDPAGDTPPAWSATGDVGFDQSLDLLVRQEGESSEVRWVGSLAEPRSSRLTNAASARDEASPPAR